MLDGDLQGTSEEGGGASTSLSWKAAVCVALKGAACRAFGGYSLHRLGLAFLSLGVSQD